MEALVIAQLVIAGLRILKEILGTPEAKELSQEILNLINAFSKNDSN